MNLQALAGETTASTDPNFNNSTFEEKFNNGWLKWYYYAVIAFTLANVGMAANNLFAGLGYMGSKVPIPGKYPLEYYNTFLFGVSLVALAGVALLLCLGLFLQFQAIRLRSLEKQDACIKIFSLYILAQAGASGFSIVSTFLTSAPALLSMAISNGISFLIVGVVYRFLSNNVKNIMLGKAEESFKFDKSAFQA